ncbi:MAG: hypothetical protein J0H77_27145, partial [Alphaproteobacteria bacterium]|nr:hypothetical protein [Alphaproteobacteria bacterium]
MMPTTRGRKENRGVNNRATVEAYDRYALDYVRSTAEGGARQGHRALAQLLEVIEPGGNVLEIGSGAGWDADWLEKAGFRVRRTDAAMAFVRFQESRG